MQATSERFNPIDTAGIDIKQRAFVMRINALGSLYYFIKIVLRRRKLTDSLHQPICQSLERNFIKDVYELPRDHFKSTICSEGLPMWWALPVSAQDCDFLTSIGYSDAYIKWLRTIHNPDIRLLLISENITNAAKLGSRIRNHFQSNDIYRALFPETLPTSSETWTNFSLTVKRTAAGGAHGEGTFDFLGVGGALQSRHYHGVIEDDLVGRKAIESPSIMEKTIDYHRLLVGAFESQDRNHENSELVVGNRWSYTDLNSHIREHEPWFRFSTHSALGGCCGLHPLDTPIFPEEFSASKLLRIKEREGAYHFSCQFLNNPCAPEDADFKEEWLNYYSLREQNTDRGGLIDERTRQVLSHEDQNGVARKDGYLRDLVIAMASDPAHGGNSAAKRCRHSIVVVGKNDNGDHYLIDCWAEACGYDKYIKTLYQMAERWRLRRVGLETVAAQKYLKYHLDYRSAVEGKTLRIIDLKGEVEAPDGGITRNKEWRIRNVLSPIFESGRFFVQRKHQDFLGEYTTFPRGRFVDILDALAYIPQLLKHGMTFEANSQWLFANQRGAREVNAAYSI